MSASEALTRDPGAVSRRPLGNRVGALRWLIPPLVAVAVVIAVNGPLAQPAPPPTVDAPVYQPPQTEIDPLVDTGVPVGVVPVTGVDTSDVDRRIAFWQDRLAATPRSNTAWVNLGDLFEVKARLTGDIASYVSAQQAFERAIEIAPRSAAAHVGAARIMNTLHDFAGALAAAETVLALEPMSSAALAVLFDASLELGDVENAALTLATLTERAAAPAVTLRAARLAFVTGDLAAAATLADEATVEAEGRGEPAQSVAFYHYAAAEYDLLVGDLDAAQAGYESARAALPGYALAEAGLGRVAFARGELATAISHLERAVAAVPRPDLLAYLGDLRALAGDAAAAEGQYATVEFSYQLASASGRVYDREHALFLADHARQPELAIEIAQAELAVRQDVFGYDALAWALHAAGRSDEALTPMTSALALGTDEPRLLIHAGLIELAAGRTADGRAHLEEALARQPSFSPLVVAAARAALER